MKVDLDHLTKEQIELFNVNIDESLTLYNEMSSVLLKRRDDVRWYINNVTSRNTVTSDILYFIRIILLLDKLSEKEPIEEVKTSNALFAKILVQNYNIECTSISNSFIKRWKKYIKNLGFCILWSFGAIRCKSAKRIEKLKLSGADIGIDVDMPKASTQYEDRYYGNVLDTLSHKQANRCFYQVIYLLRPKKNDIDRCAENTKYQLVYIWDYLTPIDYILALWNTCHKFPRSLMMYKIKGLEMSPLLKSVSDDSNSFYFFLAHLYERVVIRMSRQGIKLNGFVDWFENQSFDKSFHWAMNKYYPDTPIHAYMGMMADTKVNPISIATNEELKQSIAPKHIYVCNKTLQKQYMLSGYEGKVDVAPFYRSQKVWKFNKKEKSVNDSFVLFVPLGIFIEEVLYKTKMIVSFLNYNRNLDIKVFIKMHPACDDAILKQLIGNDERIISVKGDFYEFLSEADAVVASNSSTTYEALSCGIPAIYLVDEDNHFCLNKPEGIGDNMWYVVKDDSSFTDVINSIKKIPAKQMEVLSNEIKTLYFQPFDKKLTEELFFLD